jgi:hypothetical protein
MRPKIEIEKIHPEPLPSLSQAVRRNYPNFCWTLLIPNPESYSSPPTTYHLPPFFSTTFPLSTRNYLFFYNIPALSRPAGTRSFVFIDIPASCLHFLKLLQPPHSLERTTCCPLQSSVQKPLPAPATLKRTRGQATATKRRQQGAEQFTIHNIPCNRSSVSLLPNPESKILPHST